MVRASAVIALLFAMVCSTLFLQQSGSAPFAAVAQANSLGTQQLAPQIDAAHPRVNIHPTSGTVDWSAAPIFWFGRATQSDNYVDVRVAYDSQALYLFGDIVDYYLWYDTTGSSDPRQYDALAFYLDASETGDSAPNPGSYLFVSGLRTYPPGNDPRWHLQARGNGSAWDYSWNPATAWSDNPGYRFYNSGPNNNSDLDAGWSTSVTIPWATIGLSGPPSAGHAWRLGTELYDRDDAPPTGTVALEAWPHVFTETNPTSWGYLAFDPAPYIKANVAASGTTIVRRGLNSSVVADTYAGGGGNCSGGIYGGGDTPEGSSTNLFVQNESDISDFPCFSKSYFKFDLSAIPAGKAIISATLTVYEFGGSDPTQALPSAVQLFSVADDWNEATLTWNNAPIAHENVAVTQVPVLTSFPGWPGVANGWDATKAVAEAYAAGLPANLALYSADTAYHSGKYFASSEMADWDAAGRPTLTITWGDQPGWSAFFPTILK